MITTTLNTLVIRRKELHNITTQQNDGNRASQTLLTGWYKTLGETSFRVRKQKFRYLSPESNPKNPGVPSSTGGIPRVRCYHPILSDEPHNVVHIRDIILKITSVFVIIEPNQSKQL